MTLEQFREMLQWRMKTAYLAEQREAAKKTFMHPDFDTGFNCGVEATLATLPVISKEMLEFWSDPNMTPRPAKEE